MGKGPAGCLPVGPFLCKKYRAGNPRPAVSVSPVMKLFLYIYVFNHLQIILSLGDFHFVSV